MGELQTSERIQEVLNLSYEESRNLNHHYIGTEHLLLGLIRENKGILKEHLEKEHISIEEVRQVTLEVLGFGIIPSNSDENSNVPVAALKEKTKI